MRRLNRRALVPSSRRVIRRVPDLPTHHAIVRCMAWSGLLRTRCCACRSSRAQHHSMALTSVEGRVQMRDACSALPYGSQRWSNRSADETLWPVVRGVGSGAASGGSACACACACACARARALRRRRGSNGPRPNSGAGEGRREAVHG
jgi:hypothetical protein